MALRAAQAADETGPFSMPLAVPTQLVPAPTATSQTTLGAAATGPSSQIPIVSAPPALGAATTGPFSQLPANDIVWFLLIIISHMYLSSYIPCSDMHIHMLGGWGAHYN